MSEEIPVLRMEEALDFWRKKISMTGEDFRTLTEAYRIRAFMVSKFAQIDQIEAVRKSLDRALAQGKTMAEWRENITPFFKRAGWTGNLRYRLDTIYRTNIQTAYNAGRWAQAQDGKDDRPYAMYDAILDGRTRPTHAAQDGKVYRLDHPFWRQWWPPNGFNCRCTVRTLSSDDLDDMDLKEQDAIDGTPDEGFQVNPGHTPGEARAWAAESSKKLSNYPPEMRQHFLDAAGSYPHQIMRRYLHKRDIESMRTLTWARGQGGIDGYEDWVERATRERTDRGDRLYPAGNIPDSVSVAMSAEPRLALAIMTDRGVSALADAGLSLATIKSIPAMLRDQTTRWYMDTENPGVIVARKRVDDMWVEIEIWTDFRVKNVRANVIKAGAVTRKNRVRDGLVEIVRGKKN